MLEDIASFCKETHHKFNGSWLVLFCTNTFNVYMSVLSVEYLAADDFPEHIKSLVQKEKESEEQEKRQREIERNTCKVHDPLARIKIHCSSE